MNVDVGYTGDDFAKSIKKMTGAEVEVVKRTELRQFVVLPKRWIVERPCICRWALLISSTYRVCKYRIRLNCGRRCEISLCTVDLLTRNFSRRGRSSDSQ